MQLLKLSHLSKPLFLQGSRIAGSMTQVRVSGLDTIRRVGCFRLADLKPLILKVLRGPVLSE